MATATKTTATKGPRGPRAKSKSAAIRAYIKKHPEAGPTAVCAALKRKGIALTPAHVSNVKAAMVKKQAAAGGASATNGAAYAGRGRRGGRRGRKAGGSDSVSIGQLIEARKFAEQVGGVERAVGLLQSLARLQ